MLWTRGEMTLEGCGVQTTKTQTELVSSLTNIPKLRLTFVSYFNLDEFEKLLFTRSFVNLDSPSLNKSKYCYHLGI